MTLIKTFSIKIVIFIFVNSLAFIPLYSQQEKESILKAPPRTEGEGPFDKMIIRGGILIDGTGAPPIGPVDIIVEGNLIVNIKNVGYPGVPIDPKKRPEVKKGDKVLDIEGMYVLPGFVDMHGHLGGVSQGTPAEYVLKLWMGHGITTIRDPASGNGIEWMMEHRKKSKNNQITAPRIFVYAFFGQGSDEPISNPKMAREWV